MCLHPTVAVAVAAAVQGSPAFAPDQVSTHTGQVHAIPLWRACVLRTGSETRRWDACVGGRAGVRTWAYAHTQRGHLSLMNTSNT